MRKIFRIASLALLLVAGVSCSKDIPEDNAGSYPILFRCVDNTRAVTTVEDMKNDANGFDVHAFFSANSNNLAFTKTLKYNSNQSLWDYDGSIEYWIPGATYWFKAVYPKSVNAVVDSTSSDQALTISDFDITSQSDILVAETSREGIVVGDNGAPAQGSVVNLNFAHLLANVTIKIKAELNVTIEDVSLKYLPVRGSFVNGGWAPSSEGNIEKSGVQISLAKGGDYTDVTDGGFLVFPAALAGDEQLYIKTSVDTYELTLPLSPSTWVGGTKYTYTLTIKQNDILFNEPTVEIWDEENATGSVIIK